MSTATRISVEQLNLDCDHSYHACVIEVRRRIGHGALRDRGRWVRVIVEGDSLVDNGYCEWTGTQEQLDKIVAEYGSVPGLDGIYIEGGVDWAERRADFDAGDYEPWAGEWAVNIYLPE
jgi:hypothetical protein